MSAMGRSELSPKLSLQLQNDRESVSEACPRVSEQKALSFLRTQNHQPVPQEAFIRFQRLPGFRLLCKYAPSCVH